LIFVANIERGIFPAAFFTFSLFSGERVNFAIVVAVLHFEEVKNNSRINSTECFYLLGFRQKKQDCYYQAFFTTYEARNFL
jgi:hypothetical protein